MIIRQNRKPRAPGESVFCDPPAHRFRHAPKFRIGATLDVVVPLQLHRDIVGPALRTFDKTIVEGGHSSWRIYTKAPRAADSSMATAPGLFRASWILAPARPQ